MAGYDGGLPQVFVLEALDPNTGRIRFSGTNNETGESNLRYGIKLPSGALLSILQSLAHVFNVAMYIRVLFDGSSRA